MTNKFGRRHLFILALCAFLWNQQASILSHKIALENSYQKKVFSAVSQILGQEKILVIVSIEFSSIGGTLKKTAALQSGTSSSGKFFPGIPTVPSIRGTQPLYGSSSHTRGENDLEIGRIEVTIGMDETSITGSVKQEIKSLIEKIIPQTKDCDDCIKIEAMQFQANKKNTRLDELEKIIKILEADIRTAEADKRTADLANQNKILEDLNLQIKEVSTERDEERSMNHRRIQQLADQDSIRFVQMIAAEKLQKSQDSLKFINTEKRLERVMESKIKSDSAIIRETLSIVKQQASGDKKDESLFGIQLGSSGSEIMGSVIFILLIIALMVVTFLAVRNKKPKTIYLKPKSKEKEKAKDKKKDKKEEEENDSDEKEASDAIPAESTEPVSPTPPPPPRRDEDGMRSELRSLRQTAVSLTVGEKEGASALIKEWLEDNPNKSDEGEEETDEEAGEA